ncbi:MAG: TolC family protein [Proteobacteria bacterium]|nr:TolC family protein [Pseudomonadota bacterium]
MKALRASWMLAALVPAWVGAAEPPAVPALVAAWQGVMAQSPEYAAARARREQGRAVHSAARALWMPTLSAQGGIARRSFDSETTGAQFSAPGFGLSSGVDFRTSVHDGNARQWAFVLQQPLLDASRVADTRASLARARMAEAQFRQTEQALMVRTAETLAAVVEAEARFRAMRRQHQAAARARDTAQARYEAGDIPVTDWREAQAQLDELAVRELDTQQVLAVASAAYTDLTGLPPPMSVPDPQQPSLDDTARDRDDDSLNDWLERARHSSPMLALQSEQLALAEAEERRWSRLDGFQLNLVGQFGSETLSGQGDYGAAGASNRLATIGLQASVPLFSGGMRAAQRRAAQSGERAAQADLAAVRQRVELGTRTAWLTASTAHTRLRAQRRALLSADSRLDATRVGFDAGDRTLLDLLSAEAAALQAGAEVERARCEGLIATLRLAAAAGTLDAESLISAGSGEFACGGFQAR